MTPTILPVFLMFPKEAAIIGRILAGYGELEFDLCNCVDAAFNESTSLAARALFRVRGEEARIQIADALMRAKYKAANLAFAYDLTIAAMQWCRRIRNQFAHCHWSEKDGLNFVQIEKAAKSDDERMMLVRRYINEALLIEHEGYFAYTQACLWYLSLEFQVRAGRRTSHDWSTPEEREPPPAYIGEER